MRSLKLIIVFAAGFGWPALSNAQDARPASSQSSVRSEAGHSFHWPDGKRAAVSLGFDDARVSQIDVGLPLLEKMGAKVTFFIETDNLAKRLDGWKRAVADGNEIGNHTMTHPCRSSVSPKNALQKYDLKMMAVQLDGANEQIEKLLGVKPVDYAYPCGDKSLGKGLDISYVPLVRERFLVGRDGEGNGQINDPATVDLAQASGTDLDYMTFPQMKEIVDRAIKQGGWLISVDHNIVTSEPQPLGPGQTKKPLETNTKALEQLIAYLKDPANGIWFGTVEEIGSYVKRTREAEK